MLGGCDDSTPHADFWRLHLGTLTWERLGEAAVGTWGAPAFFHSCIVTPSGKLVTFGGVVDKKKNRRYVPAFSGVCIPS